MCLGWLWFNFNGGWFTLTCTSLAAISEAPHASNFIPLLAVLVFALLWTVISIFPVESRLESLIDGKKGSRQITTAEPYSTDLGMYVTRESWSSKRHSVAIFHKKDKLVLSHVWDRDRVKSLEMQAILDITEESNKNPVAISDNMSESSYTSETSGNTTRESSAVSFLTDTSAAPTRDPSFADFTTIMEGREEEEGETEEEKTDREEEGEEEEEEEDREKGPRSTRSCTL